MAIKSEKVGRATLQEIISYIEQKFAWYNHAHPSWTESIKNTLNQNKFFVKIERTDSTTSSGLWTLDLNPKNVADFNRNVRRQGKLKGVSKRHSGGKPGKGKIGKNSPKSRRKGSIDCDIPSLRITLKNPPSSDSLPADDGKLCFSSLESAEEALLSEFPGSCASFLNGLYSDTQNEDCILEESVDRSSDDSAPSSTEVIRLDDETLLPLSPGCQQHQWLAGEAHGVRPEWSSTFGAKPPKSWSVGDETCLVGGAESIVTGSDISDDVDNATDMPAELAEYGEGVPPHTSISSVDGMLDLVSSFSISDAFLPESEGLEIVGVSMNLLPGRHLDSVPPMSPHVTVDNGSGEDLFDEIVDQPIPADWGI